MAVVKIKERKEASKKNNNKTMKLYRGRTLEYGTVKVCPLINYNLIKFFKIMLYITKYILNLKNI